MSRWHPVVRDMDLWREFGACLRRARIEHRLKQGELAGRIGVTSAAVSSWERAVRIPDKDTIIQLMVALRGNEGWYLNE